MKRPRIAKRQPSDRGIPPDAGASYLGAYTLRNEWTIWLLANDPTLLTLPPHLLHTTDVGIAPECSEPGERWNGEAWQPTGAPCDHVMKYRPGFWCCYVHDVTVRRRIFLKPPSDVLLDADDQPVRNVLALIGSDTDIIYRDGRWRLVEPERTDA